jgi:hypothetical protein
MFFKLECVTNAGVYTSSWNVWLMLELFFTLECVANAGICPSRWNVLLVLAYVLHAGMCY